MFATSRVLLIAYDFPPGTAIGAGLRSAFFARYLPDFGWQPTVIALDKGQTVVDNVTRLASPTPWHRPYELTPYGWALALSRYLRGLPDHDFDLVYVSCPPYPQALAAAGYAAACGVPLIVDFRDAWSLDPYQEGSRLKRMLYRYLFPQLEKRLLSRTGLLILNTPSALSAYQTRYPGFAHRMSYLPNGYDDGAFSAQSVRPEGEAGVMRLLYAGRFGIGARSPQRLLAGLKIARARGSRIRLDLLGDQPAVIRAELADEEAAGVVRLLGQVDYPQAAREMMASDVLVLIQAPSASVVQAVAGKTYDYLRAARPILMVAPAGDNLDLVRAYAGCYEHAEDTPEAIAAGIANLYETWSCGKLRDSQSPDPEFTSRFERRALTAALAGQFDNLTGRERD